VATAELALAPEAVRAAARSLPDGLLRRRPDAVTWSVLEYVCHLRDVYVTSTIRLYRVRTEDRPLLEPMFNELRAARFGYNRRDLAATLMELADTNEALRAEVGRLHGDEWDRVGSRLPGETRTARWLLRQAVHEGVHHLHDIDEVGRRVTKGSATASR
jgi:hypothetical protein